MAAADSGTRCFWMFLEMFVYRMSSFRRFLIAFGYIGSAGEHLLLVSRELMCSPARTCINEAG